jgi:glycosyltransferase involved in cell wall biosynthesis
LNSGGQVRQFHLLHFLAKSHDIRLVSLVQPVEKTTLPEIQSWGVRVYPVMFIPPEPHKGWVNRMESWARLIFNSKPQYAYTYPLQGLKSLMLAACKDWRPDICQLEQLFVAPLSFYMPKIPCLLVEYNVESRNFYSQEKYSTNPIYSIRGRIEYQKLRRWEKNWLRQVNGCIAVSDADAIILKSWKKNKHVVVVPNGVDTKWFPNKDSSTKIRRGLLFFGTIGYYPNADAIHYFIKDILPLIRISHPDIELTIIGGNATKDLTSDLESIGVNFIGFVPDIRPFLKAAQICVVPLRSGGGTRLKILEAMAAGLPVVSTTVGAEGLKVSHGENILLADTPKDFCNQVIRLMEDDGFARNLSLNARRLVENEYEWEKIAKYLDRFYSELIACSS